MLKALRRSRALSPSRKCAVIDLTIHRSVRSFRLLRRQRACICDTDLRPTFKLSPCSDTFQPNSKPTLHRTTTHDKGLCRRSIGEVAGIGRIDSEHQPALPAHTHGHIAVDKKGQPTEHPHFRKAVFAVENLAEAVRESFVKGHTGEYPTAAGQPRGGASGP